MATTHLLARAVIRGDQQVLVVQADGQSHTFLPGGHVEDGEAIEACLRRELREELGVEGHVGPYRGAVEHRWQRADDVHYEINHCFAVDVPVLSPGVQPVAREAYLTFHWVSLDRLHQVDLQPAPLRHFLGGGESTPWWGSTLEPFPSDAVHPSE